MHKTKEMFDGTHKRNSQAWVNEDMEVLESSLEHWILSDKSNAIETLGEDVVWAAEREFKDE